MTGSVEDYDVVVAGGGLAGMVAAAGFGSLGLRTLCVDPAGPGGPRGPDLRSTALLQPSRAFLDRIGLWARLAPLASPLQVMRIVDAGGAAGEARTIRDFDAQDVGPLPFGWNLPNQVLRRELTAGLAAAASVTHRTGVSVSGVLARLTEARVTLSDGSRLRTRLVVAADGRNSQVRAGAGIAMRQTRYGQKALAFAVCHPVPHQDVSTEVHRTGGPFTLVPLPDQDGSPCSAVVWMERSAEAQRLMDLPEPAFNDAITERSCSLLGPLRLIGGRSLWPIISQLAERFNGERVALVAEAAHVVPPIGAQGLNMSLGDIRDLIDLVAADPDGLGTLAQLDRYNRTRRPAALARVLGVDALNRASMIDTQALRDLRMRGLGLLHDLPVLRRSVMKAGLGAT
ncbi:UbiH/UbiF family hydroxylase [Pseudoruegeria sp. SK021]|uniref:UbiH/UbiF family hydroxylase n=1 Tax=Pseudoruegeria sp. SK021 TaxID=1933035 RepID=UPI000A25F49E|nr:UbiH/UbiF family hydroxylase [Pseudoruegeria sp. SK021]OSP56667.1 2-octaprenyl-6-methoxyphenyl hydroxylase [Pseudoruegeria sp. SK021]